MKNLLLASTALIALAGAASAEVALSGTGRMGLVYDQDNGTPSVDDQGNPEYIVLDDGTLVQGVDSEMRFSSRMRLLISMSFESDLGLTFGGSFRADNAADANNGLAGAVFVSGDFGKLEMGDVSSAAEAAVGNISGVGYTGLGDPNETFYLVTGGPGLSNDDNFQGLALPGVLYTYTTGDISLYLGLGNPTGVTVGYDTTTVLGAAAGKFEGVVVNPGDTLESYNQVSLGAAYATDQYSVGIGFESATFRFDVAETTNAAGQVVTQAIYAKNTMDAWYLGGSATFGDAVVKAMWGQVSDIDYQQYGLSLDYTFDAFTATVFVRQQDLGERYDYYGNLKDSVDQTIWGVGGSYDLGAGLVIAGGIIDPDLAVEDYRADFGVNFEF